MDLRNIFGRYHKTLWPSKEGTIANIGKSLPPCKYRPLIKIYNIWQLPLQSNLQHRQMRSSQWSSNIKHNPLHKAEYRRRQGRWPATSQTHLMWRGWPSLLPTPLSSSPLAHTQPTLTTLLKASSNQQTPTPPFQQKWLNASPPSVSKQLLPPIAPTIYYYLHLAPQHRIASATSSSITTAASPTSSN